MKPKKWNTPRLAIYGAFAGLAYAIFNAVGTWSIETNAIAANIGGLIGGTVGGALLVAGASGVRNFFVR